MRKELAIMRPMLQEVRDGQQNGGIPSADIITERVTQRVVENVKPLLESHASKMEEMVHSVTNMNLQSEPRAISREQNANLQPFQMTMWSYADGSKAPSSFTLVGKNMNTVSASFKLFYLGDIHRKVSPLRYMTLREANLRPQASKDDDPALYKTQLAALTKNYRRTKTCILAISAHFALKHADLWKAFCDQPNFLTCNAVYSQGLETLKAKLEEGRAPTNSGRKQRKIVWNNLNATSFLKFFGNSKRGYLKELAETTYKDKNLLIFGSRGKANTWNFPMPKKSLGMPTIQVR